jgi:7-cyano-7-deazaguanine synthase in queuosine biosynthesis
VSAFELMGPFEEPVERNAEHLSWPLPTKRTQIRTGLDWQLSEYGSVDDAAADLLHVAAAAYLADRLTSRPTDFTREINLTVHVSDPPLWSGAAGDVLVDLLKWISGDVWTFRPVVSKVTKPDPATLPVVPPRDEVMLLSGGLDSFCGAVDRLSTVASRLHIGHRDAATSVRHAQIETHKWLGDQSSDFSWLSHDLRETARKKENTTRTRSLLFMAMAIAAATGCGASTVIVPENGFTSMNVPLLPSRGGALSTKSTHPFTFHLVNQLMAHIGITVEVVNPYIHLTKGEFLKQAAANAPDGFIDATQHTLSCAKLDAGRFKGGQPNLNCGLCYACRVRRGAFIAANIPDPTEYLVHRLKGREQKKLLSKRHDDLWAIDLASNKEVTEDDLISSASWPPGADLDDILALVRRGRRELNSVPLP